MMLGRRASRGRLYNPLMSPSTRKHLLVVGVALLVAGVMALAFLPETAALWLVVTIVVVAHAGLIMLAGSAILRVLARRR